MIKVISFRRLMAEIITYRGNQIGGCVTIISAEKNGITHRIMIDYGLSLDGTDTQEDFKELWENNSPEAVFFTHYHGDHVGRILEIPENVVIYMGETAREIMINIHEALVRVSNEENESHERMLKLLRDDKRIRTFKEVQEQLPNGFIRQYYQHITDIPGFVIEPYSVDHSAYDAYMFLVEADDATKENGKKVILHTGDFRGHGRRGKRFFDVINIYIHKNQPWQHSEHNNREVDVLITEGTMMSRMSEKVLSEPEMQLEACEYLRKHKYAFLVCSSTNLDSLTSFYQAAQDADGSIYGRYMYTYNNYFVKQLETFSKTAGTYSDVYKFEHIDVLEFNKKLKSAKMKNFKTQKELMCEHGFIAVIKPEEWCEKYIDEFVDAYNTGIIDEMPAIIYSMWEGYIDSECKAKNQNWIDFISRQESKGVEIKRLHTSGHATLQMIGNMINAVAPREAILPIHTENREAFLELDIKEEFQNIIKVD